MKQFLIFFLTVLVFQLNAQVNLSSSLSACYALNGNANEPINNLTGTLSAVTPTVDRFNNPNSAMHFAGVVGSIIKLPDSPLIKPSNDVSFSLWVKPDALSMMEIIHTTNNYGFNFSSYALTFQQGASGYIFRGYRQNGPQGSNTVDATTMINSVGNWYHVVLTIDNINSQMKIYVNGVLENTAATTISTYNYQLGKEVILGGTNETQIDPPYKGSMDNLRIYNRVITAAEVSALYSQDPACIIGSAPDPAFGVSSQTICVRDTIFLTDASANNPTSWAWTMSGGAPATSTVSNPYVIYNTPGTYSIALISSNQFGSSPQVFQMVTVVDCDIINGIRTNTSIGKVKVYPNPCTDRLAIKFAQSMSGEWALLDVLGRRVKHGKITDRSNLEINMSGEAKGLYFLNISNNGQQSVTKIIKE